MKTPEEQRAELNQELELIKGRLKDAGGRELERLLERCDEIEEKIEGLQPPPGELGTGTLGEATKRMAKGKLPERSEDQDSC